MAAVMLKGFPMKRSSWSTAVFSHFCRNSLPGMMILLMESPARLKVLVGAVQVMIFSQKSGQSSSASFSSGVCMVPVRVRSQWISSQMIHFP